MYHNEYSHQSKYIDHFESFHIILTHTHLKLQGVNPSFSHSGTFQEWMHDAYCGLGSKHLETVMADLWYTRSTGAAKKTNKYVIYIVYIYNIIYIWTIILCIGTKKNTHTVKRTILFFPGAYGRCRQRPDSFFIRAEHVAFFDLMASQWSGYIWRFPFRHRCSPSYPAW